MLSRYSSNSGISQRNSPVDSPARRSPSRSFRFRVIRPAKASPKAVTMAPVRVENSMMLSGFVREASIRASARTSLPSASVLTTSTVFRLA